MKNIYCFIYCVEGYREKLYGYTVYRAYAISPLGVALKYAIGAEEVIKGVLMGDRARKRYGRLYSQGYNLIWINSLNSLKDDFIDINEIDNEGFHKAYKKFLNLYKSNDF